MQVYVQIGGRSEALDEGDRAGGGFAAFEACLPDQMRRDHPVHDLQYWSEHFRMHREEALAAGSENDSTH